MSDEDEGKIEETFITKLGAKYPFVKSKGVNELFGIKFFPSVYCIDPSGVVHSVPDDRMPSESAIEDLLKSVTLAPKLPEDSRYDPLWRAISDSGLPICCHIGLNMALEGIAQRDPTPQKGVFVPCTALSTAEAFGMWLLTGVFERFPDLKVVFVEPGIGWVAWWLYIVDDLQARQGYEFPALKKAPSEYFHRNVFLTFIDEPNVVRYAHERLGIHNVMWSSDYPHPVSSWPTSQSIVDKMFAGVSAHDRELVVSGNAARVWNL